MVKIILFMVFTLGLHSFSTVNAQSYMKLASREVMYDGTFQKEAGRKFFAVQDTSFTIQGSGMHEKLHLKKLELYNTAFTQARLEVQFETVNPENSYSPSPGDFFITISFFDEDKNCLFSEEVVSVDGMRLEDGPFGMKEMKTEILDDKLFSYSGSWELGIHQAFMYPEDGTAGGIKGIKYCRIQVFHLGAG